MKVCIIQNVTLNDHRSVYSHNVACELVRRGMDVDVVLQKTEEELQYKERPYNLLQIPGGTYSIPGQLQFIVHSLRILKENRYDIVHAKNPFSSLFSAVLLKNMGRIPSRVIYDVRGLWIDFGVMSGKIPPYLGRSLWRVEAGLMERCDHVVAISPTLKKVLQERGVKNDIAVVFGDGVDIKRIEKIGAAGKEKGKGNVKTVGYLGTISVARQSEKIIEAFKKLRMDDAQLVMVGPVGEPHLFETLARGHNIVLTGFMPQEKAFALVKSWDVVVSYHDVDLPVYNVAVPTKVFEYMACGVPIVATDHQMYRNVLDERTAVLTAQNPEDFARGIEFVLENHERAREMAERARSEVEKYSIEKVTEQVMEVYSNSL